ncbi:hypothetical protein [Pseudomonas sp. Root562]|uniref:hypothetical protein n=2 Tax=unclassified Pseudomonas TaxID=196821 RepID=UPI0012E3AC0D|nr:hypothetical protein [Pseudomonas sp. Root562]
MNISLILVLYGMGLDLVQEIAMGESPFFNVHEKARLIRPGFFGCCGVAIYLGDGVAIQAVGTIGSDGVALQAVGAIGSDGVALQAVGAIGSDGVALQAIRTIGGDAVFDQAIGTAFCDTILDQTIRTPFSHTIFNQSIRAAFSDYRLNRGRGKCVDCENRESDAEDGLAFHDRVLRGVVGWYGANVTPCSF